MPRPKKVKRGDRVKVHYTCMLDNETVIDKSSEDAPLKFIMGKGEVIRGLEEALEDMKVGESIRKKVPAEMAYGIRHDEWVLEVGRDKIPEEWQPEIGKHLEIPRENREPYTAIITHVSPSTITLDFNHPLAGKELIFEISLLEITRNKKS